MIFNYLNRGINVKFCCRLMAKKLAKHIFYKKRASARLLLAKIRIYLMSFSQISGFKKPAGNVLKEDKEKRI